MLWGLFLFLLLFFPGKMALKNLNICKSLFTECKEKLEGSRALHSAHLLSKEWINGILFHLVFKEVIDVTATVYNSAVPWDEESFLG